MNAHVTHRGIGKLHNHRGIGKSHNHRSSQLVPITQGRVSEIFNMVLPYNDKRSVHQFVDITLGEKPKFQLSRGDILILTIAFPDEKNPSTFKFIISYIAEAHLSGGRTKAVVLERIRKNGVIETMKIDGIDHPVEYRLLQNDENELFWKKDTDQIQYAIKSLKKERKIKEPIYYDRKK